ncbi:MAG: phosphatase PAP2 family protein [Ignavibacteria bacterium]|nr:phosphatase PAP2 family protein [Ignavibacteria bacterium]
MEFLYDIDVWLFHAINAGWHPSWLDWCMVQITSTNNWRPVFVVGILALLIWGKKHGRWCAAALVVTVAIADPLSSIFLKEAIGRLRPYEALESVNQLVGSGGGSFPSNHALNNAAAAVILSWFYPQRRWLWVSIALLVGFSRIYVGVHYPSDVLGGFVIGGLVGWGAAGLARWAQARWAKPMGEN